MNEELKKLIEAYFLSTFNTEEDQKTWLQKLSQLAYDMGKRDQMLIELENQINLNDLNN